MDTHVTPRGFCAHCGYALQGLPRTETGYRCPECGGAFDPANPRTFRFQRHWRLLRWLAAPMGRSAVILCLTAAAAMLVISRPSLSTPPSTAALTHYLRPSALRWSNLHTIPDLIFTLATLTASACGLWWAIRAALRAFAQWWMESDRSDKTPLGRRHALMVLGLFIVSATATLAWPHQLAQNWVRRAKVSLRNQGAGFTGGFSRGIPMVVAPPAGLSLPEIETILRAAITARRSPPRPCS